MKRTHLGWGTVVLVIALLFLYYLLENGQQTGPAPAPPGAPEEAGYPHLRWGNPSGATADVGNRDNYLMEKKYFALSYNNSEGTPNWVSWRVVKEDLGSAPRFPFLPDGDLPDGFKKIVTEDYIGSGFDRGHMCPHSDRASDEEASKATFVMTNIVPQSSANNQKGWDQFEEYCRSLVSKQGKELYIVAGPQGQGGEGKKGRADVIARGKVVVPAKTWKVVLVLNRGAAVDADARLIALTTPNDETVGDDWRPYQASVKSVEQLTGYKFFDRADPKILDPLKERK